MIEILKRLLRNEMFSKKDVEVCVLVLFWYASAAMSVISSKIVLVVCRAPFLLCLTQFTAASVILFMLYLFKNMESSNSKMRQELIELVNVSRIVLIIAVCYTMGFILTNVAFSLGNPSFVETVKASEPVSTVVIGQIFCPEVSSWMTYASLGPIIFGVGLACYGDSTVPFWGVIFALLSNFGFSGRAVAAKILQLESTSTGVVADEVRLFLQVSCIGVFVLIPFAVYFDYTEVVYYAQRPEAHMIIPILLLNGATYTVFSLCSFATITRTNIVTHAVLNALRRVAVIVASAAYFNTKLSTQVLTGGAIAVGGVVWFSVSKNMVNSTSSPNRSPCSHQRVYKV